MSRALAVALGVASFCTIAIAYSKLRTVIADTVRAETVAEIDRQLAVNVGASATPIVAALGVPVVKELVANIARNTVLKTLPHVPLL